MEISKKSWVLFQSYSKCFISCNFFYCGKILFKLPHTFVVHRKRALFLHFLRSVLITHLMTSSLEKMSWILDPKICRNPYYSVCTVVVTCPGWPDRTLSEPLLYYKIMFEVHVMWKKNTSILLFMIFFKIIAARNHVNRMCLAADVPLVESGTAGYLGQATVIKKV